MVVELGPFPLCDHCQETNGGLVATRHRQVHVSVAGKESCVDQGLAGVIATVWTVADTLSCCEYEGGRAYVVPTAETADAAEKALTGLGLSVERTADGALRFALPAPPAEAVRVELSVDGDFVVAVAAAQRVLAAAAERLGRHTVGVDHPDVLEARAQLATAHRWLTAVMVRQRSRYRRPSGTARPAGLALHIGLLAAACWIGAATAHLISGGSTAWTVVGGIVGRLAIDFPIARVTRGVDYWRGLVAIQRIPGEQAEAGARLPAESSVLTPIQDVLADVQMTIHSVRRAIATLGGRRLRGQRHQPAAQVFFVYQAFDFVTYAAAEADLALCQASDALVTWLEAQRG